MILGAGLLLTVTERLNCYIAAGDLHYISDVPSLDFLSKHFLKYCVVIFPQFLAVYVNQCEGKEIISPAKIKNSPMLDQHYITY